MNKTTLKQSAWAKAVAFILCVAMVPVFLGNMFMYMLATNDGMYSSREKTGFYDSGFCQNLAISMLNDTLHWSWYSDDGVTETIQFYFTGRDRLLVQVTDETGKVVAQNCDGQSAYPVAEHLNFASDSEHTYYVNIWLAADGSAHDVFYFAKWAYDAAYDLLNWFVPMMAASVILFAVLFIFLMVAAGYHRDSEKVRAGWQEKIPLDIYIAAAVAACALAGAAVSYLGHEFLRMSETWQLIAAVLAAAGLAFVTVCLGCCMTIAARLKMGRYFYRHTVIYYVLRWIFRMIRKYIGTPLKSLPLVWKTGLITAGLMLLNLILVLCSDPSGEGAVLLILVVDAVVFLAVLAIAAQLRRLETSGKELASGNINYKTDTSGMLPVFRAHAEDLNNIGEGMNLAVAERMKSERFKTELITNVSHDLKTPLTSIINYVDLLSREDIQSEKAKEYIEVLQRQSQRLKKLTEDLVEASKASSGALSVDMRPTDVCELLNQAVAEYSDRLSQQQITPVLTLPEYDITIMADGRLLWRVFDNFLSNIRKYSMPGTRAYISVGESAGDVGVVFRNISRDQLNVSADELMERFVRGDSSRSTEGSGLGLNIARSLTELMGGRMELTVDGDLFKTEVIFPGMGKQPEKQEPTAAPQPERLEDTPEPERDSIRHAAAELMRKVKDQVGKIMK